MFGNFGGNPFFGGGGGYGGFGNMAGMGMPSGSFNQQYRCYPVSFIDKPQLEKGDKIVMPPSALDMLARLNISYPMLFELTNPKRGRRTHCGVLEFIAEEGMVYLPYWMMQNLVLEEGSIVTIKSATLPKGTFVKIRAQTSDFLNISNHKAVLETALRNFSAMTKGDTIRIQYNNKSYNLDILECKPKDAISLIETDLQVDFAEPLDYKEPERVPAASPIAIPGSSSAARPPSTSPEPSPAAAAEDLSSSAKFKAFTGGGFRLDGKKLSGSPPPGPSSSSSSSRPVPASSSSYSSSRTPPVPPSTSPAAAAQQGSNRLSFAPAPKAGTKGKKEDSDDSDEDEDEEDAKPKFKAFSGSGYSLK